MRRLAERIEAPTANSYGFELENVGDAISGRAPLLLGRRSAADQARAVESPYDAAERGARA